MPQCVKDRNFRMQRIRYETVKSVDYNIQFEVRQAGQTTTQGLYDRMDNREIHDSGFQNRNQPPLLGYLAQKSRANHLKRTQSLLTSISLSSTRNGTPKYSFRITSYEISQHVEYVVEMQESFKIFGRRVCNNITFRTRYSMLQKLNEKLGSKSFPPKKFFGNKDKKFVADRKKQLEYFLNDISTQRSVEFLSFIKQIKEADFNKDLNHKFNLD